MKIKSNVQMGKKGAVTSSRRCLHIGTAVMTLKCGLAHAGHSILSGNASGIRTGLDTVAKSAMEVDALMSKDRALVRTIKAGTLGLTKELKAGRRISRKEARVMLAKVREIAKKVDRLYAEGVKDCV